MQLIIVFRVRELILSRKCAARLNLTRLFGPLKKPALIGYSSAPFSAPKLLLRCCGAPHALRPENYCFILASNRRCSASCTLVGIL